MRTRISLTTQIGMGILVALLLGVLFQPNVPPSPIPTVTATLIPDQPTPTKTVAPTPLLPGPAISQTPQLSPLPFNTLPGAWMIRVLFFLDRPPQIERILYLEQGRITPLQSGDITIEILGESGEVLSQQLFQVAFFAGDPPRQLDEVTAIIVFPSLEGASQVRIIAPQGEASTTLPLP